MMELMPAWKRWGYEEGMEQGKQEANLNIAKRLLDKGFSPEEVAETVDLTIEEVRKLPR